MCPCVHLSVYTSLGGDMHFYEHLLVSLHVFNLHINRNCVCGCACMVGSSQWSGVWFHTAAVRQLAELHRLPNIWSNNIGN